MEWKNDDPNDEMVGAFIEMPQIIEDVGILRCKMGLSKKVTCLQVVLLNRQEINHLLKIGPQAFSNYLYPENGDRGHFLSERDRSSKF
jgi:SUMO ligase MMS21 Smc5/6 complex component